MTWGFSPLEVYTQRVRRGLNDEFVYRSPLRLSQLMDLILRGILPSPEIIDLTEQLPRRRQQLAMIVPSGDRLRDALVSEFPGAVTRMDSFLGLEESLWRENMREISGGYLANTPIRDISQYVETELNFPEIREQLAPQIAGNFLIRKYKLQGFLEWRLEDLFDNLNVTDKCRQIVMVKPLENKALYKLSNNFGDSASVNHSKISLVQIPSRDKKLNNYIGLTLSKYENSKDVAVVIIEEIPSFQKPKNPTLRISIEIPGERRLEDIETDGAYGTTVLKYLHDCISGSTLLEKLRGVEYTIYDLQLFTTAYDADSIREYLLAMSMHPILGHIFFSDHKTKVDEQKFILRDLSVGENSPGRRKVVIDIQARGIVFQASQRADIHDIYDTITILLSYGIRNPGLNLLGSPRFLVPRVVAEGLIPLTMDVVEKLGDGQFVLREAVFFDTHYADVCNKPSDKDILRGDAIEEDFGYYPPEALVRKIQSEGKFEFPRYESQRIKIKLNYRTERKNYILGKRKIPKSVRDSMASKGNYAFLFDFFPCRREGSGLSESEWNRAEIFSEDVKGDHILDDNKDEILPGRYARVQNMFFDSLRETPESRILRTGVQESPISFLDAVILAAESPNTNFRDWLRREARDRMLVEANPQFPDISQEEMVKKIGEMMDRFVDSRYVIRLVEEFAGVNVVVMTYVEKEGESEYALYESPHGTHPPNVFEHLRKNGGRRVVVLLRRRYNFLPDQYDILVEKMPGNEVRKTFTVDKVFKFLKSKITLAVVDAIHPQTPGAASLVDLSKQTPLEIRGTGEVCQILDSTGARAGSIFSWGDIRYPCFYTEPTPPDPRVPLENLNVFLLQKRPSLGEVFRGGSPWADMVVAGAGITNFYRESFLTSVYLWAGSRVLSILVQPVKWDERLKARFSGKPLLETPDPYVGNQFRETGFRFNDILFRLSFGKMITGMLLKVLFIEYVERLKREGPDFGEGYQSWKEGLLTLVESRDVKNLETTELRKFMFMIRDVKSLMGYYPPNPLRNLQTLEHVGKFFGGGSIRCFSRGMFDKLSSQISLLERILPTLKEFEGLGGVPANIYRTDIYDSTTILSESPGSVLVPETDLKNPDNYRLWQTRSQTSMGEVTLFDSLYPELFETSFTLQPLIGFYGTRGTGLWSIRPPAEKDPEIPVIKTSMRHGEKSDIPRIAYRRDPVQVGVHEDPEDKRVIRLEKIL